MGSNTSFLRRELTDAENKLVYESSDGGFGLAYNRRNEREIVQIAVKGKNIRYSYTLTEGLFLRDWEKTVGEKTASDEDHIKIAEKKSPSFALRMGKQNCSTQHRIE